MFIMKADRFGSEEISFKIIWIWIFLNFNTRITTLKYSFCDATDENK